MYKTKTFTDPEKTNMVSCKNALDVPQTQRIFKTYNCVFCKKYKENKENRARTKNNLISLQTNVNLKHVYSKNARTFRQFWGINVNGTIWWNSCLNLTRINFKKFVLAQRDGRLLQNYAQLNALRSCTFLLLWCKIAIFQMVWFRPKIVSERWFSWRLIWAKTNTIHSRCGIFHETLKIKG